VSVPLLAIRAAPGDLDTSFGVGGKRFAPMMTTSGNGGQKVALQADGKAVICGYTFIGGSNIDGSVARFTTGGALDTTFGGTGKVNVAIGPREDFFNAVAVQGGRQDRCRWKLVQWDHFWELRRRDGAAATERNA
jgi:hypothetical protein